MGHGSISSLALSLSIQAWSHSTPSGKAEQLLGNDAVEWAYKIVAAARVQEVVNNKPITILQCEQEKKKNYGSHSTPVRDPLRSFYHGLILMM